jgi:hypothetical protein
MHPSQPKMKLRRAEVRGVSTEAGQVQGVTCSQAVVAMAFQRIHAPDEASVSHSSRLSLLQILQRWLTNIQGPADNVQHCTRGRHLLGRAGQGGVGSGRLGALGPR